MSAWQAYIDKTLIGAGVANKVHSYLHVCHSIRPKFFSQAAIVAFDGSLLASR
jgi:hypothetical protein